MAKDFTKSFIYKYRHLLAFIIMAILLYYFVCFGFARVPSGLSPLEVNSAIAATNFVFPAAIIDLPYHAIQFLSIEFFGVSAFSIRWPSIVLAIMTSGLAVLTVRNLFRSNVAIITGLIAISGVLFLNIARTGSPMMMTVCLIVLAIFAFSQYLSNRRPKNLWPLISALSLVLLAYSPLGIYFLIASIVLAIFHPRARAAIMRFKPYQIILICLIGILLLSPLVVSVALEPTLALTLLGLDGIQQLSPETLGGNLAIILLPWDNAISFATPLISFVGLAIGIIGAIELARDRHSARSYMVLVFLVIALALTAISANHAYILFIPMLFLTAAGVHSLIYSWYGFFPLNPVARLAGLIPLSVLIVGLVLSSHMRFVNNSFHNADVVYDRNYTFEAVKATVNQHSGHQTNLVVSDDEMSLYGLITREYPELEISTEIDKKADTLVLVPSTFSKTERNPSQVVAGWTRHNNVLVKVYER